MAYILVTEFINESSLDKLKKKHSVHYDKELSNDPKNLKRIKLVKKYEKRRKALKKIIKNKKLELSERFAAQLKLNKLPKNSAKIRIRNRCEVSGRPHGVYRKLKISRIALRDMASAGKIPGITKSSW